jgi:hypothetical protein
MVAIAALILFIAVCVLAAVYGVDSRFDQPGRQL